ncbi:hypothetical protein [Bacillus paralicheniformis]|nr:hypothetical protein [Bacillus paralicheniformis]MEC1021396.1 hypothetical protein [Bacillus paralicheniformis]MEC1028063.1 hypothetical protein [Bacillus paralicheniformis]MEC1053530.1 hypothetical protein [Bacillus paralicheniformis]MEC1064994.1 hypothetical protein [Bacillus paralicheniformis]MEC1083994.1 hypothetical protein [Bacillus paralicheniformis]
MSVIHSNVEMGSGLETWLHFIEGNPVEVQVLSAAYQKYQGF